MQRSINQRGRQTLIVLEFVTNVKGAVNELQIVVSKFDEIKIGDKFSGLKIQSAWMFNPFSSPHMGGAWEKMIRAVKEAMFGIIKNTTITDFRILTLLSEVEFHVNNAPLTYLSEDCEDLELLAHFLIGRNCYSGCLLDGIGVKDICRRKHW